jgi:hypothetical protein
VFEPLPSGLPCHVRIMSFSKGFLPNVSPFPQSTATVCPRLAMLCRLLLRSHAFQAPLAQLAEQQTLNLRVRGSSPWRRTGTDLGFHRSRSFLCVRFVPMLAPCSLVSLDPVGAGRSTLAGSGPRARSSVCRLRCGRDALGLGGGKLLDRRCEGTVVAMGADSCCFVFGERSDGDLHDLDPHHAVFPSQLIVAVDDGAVG